MSSAKMKFPFIPTAIPPARWCAIGSRTGGSPVQSPSQERRIISAISHSPRAGPGSHLGPSEPSQRGCPVNACASWVTAAHETGTAITSGLTGLNAGVSDRITPAQWSRA